MATNVLILGAAGRDFHVFNACYRDDPGHRVVAFTAAQIPDIADRRYPPTLAGSSYPDGIPIHDEADLEHLIADLAVDEVVFAYSDVSYDHVMALAARTVAAGASFRLAGDETMLRAPVPVVAVTASRTGAGKSQTSRALCRVVAAAGRRVVAVRHPMPYGDLAAQAVQRFETAQDLTDAAVTIEEREEYEPYLRDGVVVYAGVDYGTIVERAAAEADVIVWDGGNNDLPFVVPDLWVCVLDPFRSGHELRYWPGSVNLRRADVVVINKVATAPRAGIDAVRANVATVAPEAAVIEAASPVTAADPTAIAGRRVLVVEDGPSITHGDMAHGAGLIAAERHGARELIDPRPHAAGSIAEVYDHHPHIGPVLPAMGYTDDQLAELEATIADADPECIVIGTPVDLAAIIDLGGRPSTRVRYELSPTTGPSLETVLAGVIDAS